MGPSLPPGLPPIWAHPCLEVIKKLHKGDSFKAYKTNYQTILRKYHLTQLSISTFFSCIMVIADYCLSSHLELSSKLRRTTTRSLFLRRPSCFLLLRRTDAPPWSAVDDPGVPYAARTAGTCCLCGGAAHRIRRCILVGLLISPHLACTGTVSKCLHPPTVHERHCDLQVFDQYSIH